ncbi:hypothetical protein [Tepidiphilus margaritifer]|uniref:hypothetical protein n=1 Tax=Tepidiphilus margaritifer TaxID=203471 RepID=UPI00040C819E|nr:hypothetical protein [Tepidiphilus margaritifer]
MLTLRDCLDYCSLTEEEIGLLAEHHDLPAEAAGLIACSLTQSDEGIVVLTNWLLEIAERALAQGDATKAQRAHQACKRLLADHPLHTPANAGS